MNASHAESTATSTEGPTRMVRPGEKVPGMRETGVVNHLIARIGAKVQGTETMGVFSTIGRARRMFVPWLVYSATMMPFGYLSRKETELVILRVAHLKGSEYEAAHHRKLGASVGLSAEEITAMEGESHGQTRRRGVILDAAEQIVLEGEVDESTWSALASYLSDREIVALVMLVTNYAGLATALSVLGTPVDRKRNR
ncbi:carboxymuconolactone decarboxylase family protein [Corynebacterium kalidii]|uniref:Carboxymuconolactone decarboxylase family protein n=1 Tax=Corynebacterium kalidii TaxID=2931982 RepID=A0A9X1WKZ2_9CORY|nr:carboxymuconolactone decarboxylase family protein [Corynebacterium kalidii]MCJ7859462.1 carboxymuconolactone decarboxylase family protein [Corynebacterium kalidii]